MLKTTASGFGVSLFHFNARFLTVLKTAELLGDGSYAALAVGAANNHEKNENCLFDILTALKRR